MGVNYQELKEFFLNKLTEELLNNEIYFEEDSNGNVDEKVNRDNEQREKEISNEIYRSVYVDKETNFDSLCYCLDSKEAASHESQNGKPPPSRKSTQKDVRFRDDKKFNKESETTEKFDLSTEKKVIDDSNAKNKDDLHVIHVNSNFEFESTENPAFTPQNETIETQKQDNKSETLSKKRSAEIKIDKNRSQVDQKLVHKDSLELNKKALEYKKLRQNSFELTGGDHIRIEFDKNFTITEVRDTKSAEETPKVNITKQRPTKSSGNYEQENKTNEKKSRIPRSKTNEPTVKFEKTKVSNNEKKSTIKPKNDKEQQKKSKNLLPKNNLNKKSVSELQEMSLDDIKNELSPKKDVAVNPEIKREKSFNQKDKNNNKKSKTEQEFSEVTQNFHHKPTKNQIFDKNETLLPSLKNKRNSLPSSPMPSMNFSKEIDIAHAHPINIHPNCYKQNYKSVCYCNTSSTCDYLTKSSAGKVNRYSCCCYEKLKESFDFDSENNFGISSPTR